MSGRRHHPRRPVDRFSDGRLRRIARGAAVGLALLKDDRPALTDPPGRSGPASRAQLTAKLEQCKAELRRRAATAERAKRPPAASRGDTPRATRGPGLRNAMDGTTRHAKRGRGQTVADPDDAGAGPGLCRAVGCLNDDAGGGLCERHAEAWRAGGARRAEIELGCPLPPGSPLRAAEAPPTGRGWRTYPPRADEADTHEETGPPR
ncbi:MAG TPA: hypothetical protein VMW52_03275, partial [Phycisphaerae bacterium]|nr:hypothetical protein [Phycisphaerae bacterium]